MNIQLSSKIFQASNVDDDLRYISVAVPILRRPPPPPLETLHHPSPNSILNARDTKKKTFILSSFSLGRAALIFR